jgi:hypothetical protein
VGEGIGKFRLKFEPGQFVLALFLCEKLQKKLQKPRRPTENALFPGFSRHKNNGDDGI